MEFTIKSKKHGEFIVLIDDGATKILSHKWGVTKNISGFYAVRSDYSTGKKKTVILHRCITNCPRGKVVDHKNGNTLDNRKSNLRICTIAENSKNQKKTYNGKTSVYKGVYLKNKRNKYVAEICANRVKHHLGYFETEIEAAEAYNTAAIQYHGEFANLNILNTPLDVALKQR